MNQAELGEVLRKHRIWLNGGKEGERADLRGADLFRTDLRGADLQGADLYKADLRGADLQGANLYEADLRGADLFRTDLRGADLFRTDLRGADLRGADLYNANLQGTNLQGVDLQGADLREADLWGADLDYSVLPLWRRSMNAKYDDRQVIQFLYHTLSAAQSEHVSEEVKKVLFSPEVVEIANRFHRVDECGKIKSYEETKKNG